MSHARHLNRRLGACGPAALVLSAALLCIEGCEADPPTDPGTSPTTIDASTTADARADSVAPTPFAGAAADAATPASRDATVEVGPGAADAAMDPGLRCQADAALPQLTDYAQPGPHAVGILELTFDDGTRPIEETAEHPAASSRRLPTRIYYPAASESVLGGSPPLAEGGPFPMLMYSHGYSSNMDESNWTGRHAASHGYVVVAPTFPLTSLFANGGSPDTKDIPNQPGDISFLIDRLLEFSTDPENLLAGAVDPDRIGAVGVSAGGLTTLLVSLHAKYHDPRIRAAVPVAPLASFFEPDYYHATRRLPLLILYGDIDAFLDYETNGRRAYERAWPNAYLLTVARGSHAAFAFPIDSAGEDLLAGLLVPPEWSRNNPDAIGCAGVGDTLQGTGLAVLETLEGPYVDRDATVAPEDVVCAGDEMTMDAMDTDRQRVVMAEAVVSFFDANFGDSEAKRHDGCRYLVHELAEDDALTLE